jgi:hypothetical protein
MVGHFLVTTNVQLCWNLCLHYNVSLNALTLEESLSMQNPQSVNTHHELYYNTAVRTSNPALVLLLLIGQDSSVSIETRYRLDSPGIKSRWGRDFLHLSRPAPRPTQPPIQWVLGISQG